MKKLFSLSIIFFVFVLFSCSSDVDSQANTRKDNTANTAANGNTDANGNSNVATPAPEADSKKKALLKKMIGTHKLESISGAAGMNSLFDYTQEAGQWKAIGSSNSGGIREEYDIELTEKHLNVLNSIQVTVKDDLTVVLSSEGTEQFSVAYQEKGMVYSAKEKVSGAPIPEGLNAESDFVNGELFLYLKVSSEEEVKALNLVEIFVDALALWVNETDGTFTLSVFNANCCDNSNFTFKKS